MTLPSAEILHDISRRMELLVIIIPEKLDEMILPEWQRAVDGGSEALCLIPVMLLAPAADRV